MDLELTGKVALITGGSRGIGKAVAIALAKEGSNIALAARDPERLGATAREIEAMTGVSVSGYVVDTGDEQSVIELVREVIGEYGHIDILVNAAAKPGGQGTPPTYDQVTTELFFEDMNV